MNYELASKLKNAGFPHIHFDTIVIGSKKMTCNEVFPSLSTLIEECGDGFENLTRTTNTLWHCNQSEMFDENVDGETCFDGYEYETEGESAEEAVANLWLELNKK